jgi:subtilisin family serine protease
MKFLAKHRFLLVNLMVVCAAVFLLGAAAQPAVSDALKNYIFFADTAAQAQKISRACGVDLLSWQYGVGVVQAAQTPESAVTEFYEDTEITVPVEKQTSLKTRSLLARTQTLQWFLDAIHAEDAWNTTKGDGVTVAVIDSGVDSTHKALAGCLEDASTVIPADQYGDGKTFPASYAGSQDNLGHGTHVAGIVAATDTAAGISGVAPDVKLISIKALDAVNSTSASGRSSWVAAAINKAVEDHAQVINLSIGGAQDDSPILQHVIQQANDAGVVVVCAGGNIRSQAAAKFYPAAYDETIAVSAVEQSGSGVAFASSYSNFGDWIDLCAPGTNIYSSLPGNVYGMLTGTSMACPMVTGGTALLLSVDPTLTPAQVRTLLCDSALDCGDAGRDDKCGSGMLDVAAALDLLEKRSQPIAPVSDCPDGSTISENQAVNLSTESLNGVVHYTLDSTIPNAASPVWPAQGLSFHAGDEITLMAITVQKGAASAPSVFTYHVVPTIEALSASSGSVQGVLPNAGAWPDPVTGAACRWYSVEIPAGQTLTASFAADGFTPVLNLYDDTTSTAVRLAAGADSLSWRNDGLESKKVWLSLNAQSTAAKYPYTLSWTVQLAATPTSSSAPTPSAQTESTPAASSAPASSTAVSTPIPTAVPAPVATPQPTAKPTAAPENDPWLTTQSATATPVPTAAPTAAPQPSVTPSATGTPESAVAAPAAPKGGHSGLTALLLALAGAALALVGGCGLWRQWHRQTLLWLMCILGGVLLLLALLVRLGILWI